MLRQKRAAKQFSQVQNLFLARKPSRIVLNFRNAAQFYSYTRARRCCESKQALRPAEDSASLQL